MAASTRLSHRGAAALWGLLPPPVGPVEVSVVGTSGRGSRKGIRIHRRKALAPASLTAHRGIAVTRPRLTIADLRPIASASELRRAIRRAGVLGLAIEVEASLERTRSDLELAFLRLCRRHRIPPPAVNVPVAGLEADFLWPDRRLIVETDGYRYHRGRAAFEHDRARDLSLRALGYEVIRLSHRQVAEEPGRTAGVLKLAMGVE